MNDPTYSDTSCKGPSDLCTENGDKLSKLFDIMLCNLGPSDAWDPPMCSNGEVPEEEDKH